MDRTKLLIPGEVTSNASGSNLGQVWPGDQLAVASGSSGFHGVFDSKGCILRFDILMKGIKNICICASDWNKITQSHRTLHMPSVLFQIFQGCRFSSGSLVHFSMVLTPGTGILSALFRRQTMGGRRITRCFRPIWGWNFPKFSAGILRCKYQDTGMEIWTEFLTSESSDVC